MQSDRESRTGAVLGPDRAASVDAAAVVMVAVRARGAAPSSPGVTPGISELQVPV